MRSLRLSDFPPRLDEASFWALVGTVEHEQLDFKRGVPDEVKNTIPAMAMTDGGLIVHGVSDDRKLVGCPLSQNTLDRITRYAHECGVEVQVREVDVSGTKVTIAAVPEVRGRIVTTPDGRLLRRIGGDCQPLVSDALARFVREREEWPAEIEVLPAFDLDDIDLALVNDALRADGRPVVRRPHIERALVDFGLARPAVPPLDAQYLRAAALLFAKRPVDYVPGAAVQLVRRDGVGPGPGPTMARRVCSAPLPRLLEQCLQFIAEHTARYEVVVGARRESLPQYPTTVLREGILNAVAHRDYGLSGATVDVTVWDDRIEIRSPGPLPGHITVDNMRDEHYSRNGQVMRVLKLLGFVEEYGEGVDRMFADMEARLMEPPIFVATPSSVTVTLRNRFLVDVEDQAWLAFLASYDLSPLERRVLVLARHEEHVTPRGLRQALQVDDVDGLIAGAVVKGLLVREGEKGGTRYRLSDEVVLRAGTRGVEAQSRKRQMLLDEMRRTGSISTAEGAALLGEDQAVVRGLLHDLTHAGLAQAEGRTRGRRYRPT